MPPGSPESQEDPAEPRKEMEEDMIKHYKKQRKLEVQNLNLVKTQFELMEKAGRVGRKLCEDRLQEIEDNKEKEVGEQKHYFLIKKIFLWTTFWKNEDFESKFHQNFDYWIKVSSKIWQNFDSKNQSFTQTLTQKIKVVSNFDS